MAGRSVFLGYRQRLTEREINIEREIERERLGEGDGEKGERGRRQEAKNEDR